MKIYAVFLLLLLLVLQYKFWFEEGGYIHNIQLEKKLLEMKSENEKLQNRNRELARKIILVKEDLNEIEALARQNLGMIKEGERYMFIIDKNKQATNIDKTEKEPVINTKIVPDMSTEINSRVKPIINPIDERKDAGRIIRE